MSDPSDPLPPGARAQAAAAAEIAEEPQLAVVSDLPSGATEHEVSLERAADGSLGVSIDEDEEGRPVVAIGRDGLECDDIIVSIDGTEVDTVAQVHQEMRLRAQQGFGVVMGEADVMCIRIRRPPLLVTPTIWASNGLTIAAGTRKAVPLAVQQPSLGHYAFACYDKTVINFQLTASGLTGASTLLSAHVGAASGQGTFRVPHGAGFVTCNFDNTAARLYDVDIQATVTLTPLSEAIALEEYKMRASLEAQASHLHMLEKHEEGLHQMELELERKLANMRIARHVAGLLRDADAQTHAELSAAAADLLEAKTTTSAYSSGTVADEPGSASLLASDDVLAATEAAIAASKEMRALALTGRRNVRGRAFDLEESYMRAQVLSADLDQYEDDDDLGDDAEQAPPPAS